jgi:hypothetical protein
MPHAVSIFSFFGIIAVPIAFVILVVRALPEPQRPSLDKLKHLESSELILFLKRLVAGTIIGALTIATAVGLFALIAFFPILDCNGGQSRGNCGLGLMASLPSAMLTIPLDIVAAFYVCKFCTFWYWPQASPPPLPGTTPDRTINGPDHV